MRPIEELLKGTTISDHDPDWKCEECSEEALISYGGKYYCNEHWAVELGLKKES